MLDRLIRYVKLWAVEHRRRKERVDYLYSRPWRKPNLPVAPGEYDFASLGVVRAKGGLNGRVFLLDADDRVLGCLLDAGGRPGKPFDIAKYRAQQISQWELVAA